MCARFQFNPKECHFVAAKQILRYLVHTPHLGLQLYNDTVMSGNLSFV
jgi:hypothetical protein